MAEKSLTTQSESSRMVHRRNSFKVNYITESIHWTQGQDLWTHMGLSLFLRKILMLFNKLNMI